jgi:hypothetical protein
MPIPSNGESIMKMLMLICGSLLAMAFSTATTPVHAQTLGWVSSNGSDANNCSQTSPCATFAGVIGKGGFSQINCLGSGNYGALNAATLSITSSIIIDCGEGNVGEMQISTIAGGNAAININASSALTVVLRHLSLNGSGVSGSGTYGIFTQSFPSGTLIVENCTIHGFGAGGIEFDPSLGRGTLVVSNSLLYGNGGESIKVAPSSGQIASVAIDGVKIINGADGLSLEGAGVVAGTIRHSLVGLNSNVGIFVSATGGVFFSVEESTIVDNLQQGIRTTSAAAIVNVGASTIGGNGTGVRSDAGSIISFGNNQMSANGSNGTFTSTTALQ